MTLGGLALAVGILVDDATVTIENINWHLEQGKEIELAILDGARQIVVPATVSLLCICIVFVPMFGLGGVSGYLFRPMAEAVVFALCFSYLLSRTLVNTLAVYLLAAQARCAIPSDNEHLAGTPRQPQSAGAVSARLRSTDSRISVAATAACSNSRWHGAEDFIVGFLAVVLVSFGSCRFSARISFRRSIPVKSCCISAPRPARELRKLRRSATIVEQIRAPLHPACARSIIVDNIGLPISGINMAYANSGTIGPADADILISLKENQRRQIRPRRRICGAELPQIFPGTTFAFLPADMVSQILNFGLPAPIDVQVIGH